jgi:hypothetical protein
MSEAVPTALPTHFSKTVSRSRPHAMLAWHRIRQPRGSMLAIATGAHLHRNSLRGRYGLDLWYSHAAEVSQYVADARTFTAFWTKATDAVAAFERAVARGRKSAT